VKLTYFYKIVDDLKNIEVKLDDEDKALLLHNTFPKTYEHFKDSLLFGNEHIIITLKEVLTLIWTKKLQKFGVQCDLTLVRTIIFTYHYRLLLKVE